MKTYNLRRFSKVEMLRNIERANLLAFLEPYRGYFLQRELELPDANSDGEINYAALSKILLTPDATTPQDLIEALFYIDELCTPEGIDALQEKIEGMEIDLLISEETADADLVLKVWLYDRDIIEQVHAEQHLYRPRSFEYFRTSKKPVPIFKQPSEEKIKELEDDLNAWFVRKRRERSARVFVYPKEDYIWSMVRHGELFSRQNTIGRENESSSVYFRPEKYDVIVYDPSIGEIRMKACSKGEKELFRTSFGLHFFGDEEFFDCMGKFTLEPLRTIGENSIACHDIEGIDWVKLKEIRLLHGGKYKDSVTYKSADLFPSFCDSGMGFPMDGRLTKAGFLIKFSDAKTPRTIMLDAGNRAQYKRDDDAEILEHWLRKRDFIAQMP